MISENGKKTEGLRTGYALIHKKTGWTVQWQKISVQSSKNSLPAESGSSCWCVSFEMWHRSPTEAYRLVPQGLILELRGDALNRPDLTKGTRVSFRSPTVSGLD